MEENVTLLYMARWNAVVFVFLSLGDWSNREKEREICKEGEGRQMQRERERGRGMYNEGVKLFPLSLTSYGYSAINITLLLGTGAVRWTLSVVKFHLLFWFCVLESGSLIGCYINVWLWLYYYGLSCPFFRSCEPTAEPDRACFPTRLDGILQTRLGSRWAETEVKGLDRLVGRRSNNHRLSGHDVDHGIKGRSVNPLNPL